MNKWANQRIPGLHTEDLVEKLVAQDITRQALEKKQKWCQAQIENCPVVNADGVKYTDIMQQMGRELSSEELERRLSKLNKNLRFETNWRNHTKKALYRIQNINGELQKEFLCAYENGVMPERSVMKQVLKEVMDPEFLGGRQTIARSDLPKYEVVPDEKSPLGQDIVFDPDAKRPGMKYEVQGHGEAIRGWRTVLLALVNTKAITVNQAEREFGSDNRPEWAYKTGKQKEAVPIW